jgi:LacI family transcriptional regulator
LRQVKHKVTLKDIAEAVGCSKAVASTVLNGSRSNIGVSEKTREKVLAAAKRLNYQANFASQSLALKRTRTLGVFIDGGKIAGHYHAAILSGIEQAAQARQYDVLLVNFAGNATLADCIEKLGQARIDGLLLLHTGRNERLIDAVLEATQDVVAVDSLDPPDRLQAVCYDQAAAVELALDHLTGLGHRRIAYAGPCSTKPIAHNLARAEAFELGMKQRSLPYVDAAVTYDQKAPRELLGYEAAGRHAAEQLLAIPAEHRPTAAIAYNDQLAVAMIHAMRDMGVSVPEDFSLVTFEDTPIARAVTPALTCLVHPVTEMSHTATLRLIDTVEGTIDTDQADGEPQPWHVMFDPTLIVRDSTAAFRLP